MRQSHPGSFRQQATFLRRQFLQDGDLPFTGVLTEGVVADALTAVGGWLEPRVKKRRWNHYGWLTRPRAEMKRRMAKRVTHSADRTAGFRIFTWAIPRGSVSVLGAG